MINIYIVAAFWFLSALISTVIANRLKISNALMEIIIGAIVGFLAFKSGFTEKLALDTDWMKFIAGVAAIMLTFLAGSELNPDSLKSKFKEITIVGLVGFFFLLLIQLQYEAKDCSKTSKYYSTKEDSIFCTPVNFFYKPFPAFRIFFFMFFHNLIFICHLKM